MKKYKIHHGIKNKKGRKSVEGELEAIFTKKHYHQFPYPNLNEFTEESLINCIKRCKRIGCNILF